MKAKLSKITRSSWLIGSAAFILGALVILAIRFATYHPREIHYHANFAFYMNGQREQFKNIFYYISAEDSCSIDAEHKVTPYDRAHMHNSVNDVVHVEDEAVTWGHFFQNIGWVIDTKVIRTPDKIFLADSRNKLSFVLNGKQTDKVLNKVIGDQDRLLVDFGPTDSRTLQKEYESIASTAAGYNGSKDSGSCGAAHEGNSWQDRMRHMF